MNGSFALLAPLGLLALLAPVAIVILHMRRRRPPPLELPSLRFWQAVRSDAADQRRFRRPPLSWLLVLQILATVLVALALARPSVPSFGFGETRSTPQHQIVLLDGSTSMLALVNESGARTRWDEARAETLAVVDGWQAGDVVTVITMGEHLQSQSASTERQVRALRDSLSRASAPGGVAHLSDALRLAGDLTLPDRSNQVIVVTDGALQVDPAVVGQMDVPIRLDVVRQAASMAQNVAVTSIGVRPVAGSSNAYRLSFTATSFSDRPVRLPYRIRGDANELTKGDLSLAPGESRSVVLTLPDDVQMADVLLDVRDGFPGDNRAAVLVNGAGGQGLRMLLVSDTPTVLERALGSLPDARVDVFPASTPGIKALAAGYDLVVFEGTSPSADDVPTVPMLFVHPLSIGDRFTGKGVMSSPSVTSMATGEPVLDGVDLAGVTFGDTPIYTLAAGETQLVGGSGGGQEGPLVWQGALGNARYIAFGFDLATSNITQRVAFPVLVARSVMAITTPPLPGVLSPGQTVTYATHPNTASVAVSEPGGKVTTLTVPDQADAVVIEAGSAPGLTSVRELDAQGGQVSESAFVVNAGSLAESNLAANPALASTLATSVQGTNAVTDQQSLSDLWAPLAACALVLLLVEWLVWSLRGQSLPRIRMPVRRKLGGTG